LPPIDRDRQLKVPRQMHQRRPARPTTARL
jgi:hypothetical protein